MTVLSTNTSAASRWVAWLMIVPWVAGGSLYALLMAMLHFGIVHPHFLPVVFLLTILVISSCLAVLAGLWRVGRGPQRLSGLRLMAVSTMPMALLAFHGSVANAKDDNEHRMAGYGERLLEPLAASLMDLEARFRFPDRTVGRKVVMIHAGNADATEQVEASDRHIERMERFLGRQMAGTVHWVRGRLLGHGGVAFWGMAFGSQSAERTQSSDGLTTVDRHELAHAAIDDLSEWNAPPAILVEGWAESQSGYPLSQLYGKAARLRDTWAPLKDLILPGHPYFATRIYVQGGVLVDYLLSQIGGPAFEAFYHDSSAQTFDSDCRRHLGMSVDELDVAYSRHLDDMIAGGAMLRASLEATPCGPNVDPAKWRAMVGKYIATVYTNGGSKLGQDKYDHSFTSIYKEKSFLPPLHESSAECRYALSGRYGFRMEVSTESWQTLFLAKPAEAYHLIRQAPEKPWVAQPIRFAGEEAAKDRLNFIRQDAIDLLTPSFLNHFWNRAGAEGATVTKLEEFEEDGKPRVRVTMEFPMGPDQLVRRETTVAAVDQAYAPLRIDVQNLQAGGSTVRVHADYQRIQNRPILRRQAVEVLGPGGQLVREFSTEIKDYSIGPQPPESFTLKALGVNESDIVEEPHSVASADPPVTWQTRLPWFVGGWLLFCVVGLVATARSSLLFAFRRP